MDRKGILLQKLYDGSSTPQELEELLVLLKQDPNGHPPDILDLLGQQSKTLDTPTNPQAKARVWANITKMTKEAKNAPIPLPQTPGTKRLRTFYQLGGVAAALLLCLVMSIILFMPSRETAWVTHRTPYGDTANIRLPDGSLVILNSNSELKYHPNWQEGEDREVHLVGEAYFQVEKKPQTQAKFKVITQNMTISVLGTVFNVNNRAQETRVFLEEGKVNITLEDTAKPALTLNPGEVVRYIKPNKQLLNPEIIDGKLETSWKNGVLEFKDNSLLDILTRLSEINELKFDIVGDRLSDRIFTLAIPLDNVALAMEVLRTTTQTDIQKSGDTYVIREKKDYPN